ncbi:Aspartyl protease [Phaffia rhodozyma]|uniref:Aspartyl protease n=1 Tax=Phaffia rhodozyma TaxID=264483 RepID=A0A0F7SGM2_PHARH|nr:Aspartyl protease [Phaffia rhodozyma]
MPTTSHPSMLLNNIPSPLPSRHLTQRDSVSPRADVSDWNKPVVLDLTLTSTSTGVYYTLPVSIGGTSYMVQVDTGSSDLWLASSSCTSSSCQNVHLYNPSSSSTSMDADTDFSIDYVSGTIKGRVFWDQMEFAGRKVPRQAAAYDVVNQDMRNGAYSGVMGLSLPGNSIIANTLSQSPWNLGPLSNIEIPPFPVTDPSQDYWLYPSSRRRRRRRRQQSEDLSSRGLFDGSKDPTNSNTTSFISLSLARPSDPRIPSQLGVRSHLPSICDASCQGSMTWSSIIEGPTGQPLFWRVPVRSISVIDGVSGKEVKIAMGQSRLPGNAWPVAILDSGAQNIYTSNRDLLDAIYGSQGQQPASDGNYYIPCTTAIQMTITLSTIGTFPIHPLDLSGYTSGDSTHQTCIGNLQYITPAALAGKGDIVLGAAFMRNVYTVLSGPSYTQTGAWQMPQLSLYSLTANMSSAVEEFQRVRVLEQEIAPGSGTTSGAHSATGSTKPQDSDRALNTAGIVGLAVGCVVCLGLAIFAWLFFVMKRRLRREMKFNRLPPDGSSSSEVHYTPALTSPDAAFIHTESKKRTVSYQSERSVGSYFSTAAPLYTEVENGGGNGGEGTGATGVVSPGADGPVETIRLSVLKRGSSSLLGGGFEDADDVEMGIDGTSAPTMTDVGDLYSDTGPGISQASGRWRIQDDGSGTRPSSKERTGPGASAGMSARNLSALNGDLSAGAKKVSASDAASEILRTRREARQSRCEPTGSSSGSPLIWNSELSSPTFTSLPSSSSSSSSSSTLSSDDTAGNDINKDVSNPPSHRNTNSRLSSQNRSSIGTILGRSPLSAMFTSEPHREDGSGK